MKHKSMITLIINNDCFNLLSLMFRELGVNVDLLSPDIIKKKFPWLNVDDIELGSLGTLNSGW